MYVIEIFGSGIKIIQISDDLPFEFKISDDLPFEFYLRTRMYLHDVRNVKKIKNKEIN